MVPVDAGDVVYPDVCADAVESLLEALSEIPDPRKARFKGLAPNAYYPERIEFFNQYPRLAVKLMKGAARL